MLRKTAVTRTLGDFGRKWELEKGIHNVQMIRIWKKRNGYYRKAYDIFKDVHGGNISREDLMTISWNELLLLLESHRTGITQRNKAPKPKWIHQ